MIIRDFLRIRAGLSGSQTTRLKKLDDGIVLNGERVTVRARLHTGDILSLFTEDRAEETNPYLIPVSLPLDILFEDDYFIAVNKPSGMPTHTSHGHRDDTLANALLYYYTCGDGIINGSFIFRAINRLDLEVSGIVIVAKTRISAYALSKQLACGGFTKRYTAILNGIPPQNSGIIKSYIRRREESIITRASFETGSPSEYAITKYSVISSRNGISTVLAEPVTGRTHQLRVHFASINAPILGDTLYGSASPLISRCALHCSYLSFTHPDTGKAVVINAPLPHDMKSAIAENER